MPTNPYAELIAEAREMCAKATPGPWNTDNPPVDHEGCEIWPWHYKDDMEFAYYARTAVPKLLDALEAAYAPGEGRNAALIAEARKYHKFALATTTQPRTNCSQRGRGSQHSKPSAELRALRRKVYTRHGCGSSKMLGGSRSWSRKWRRRTREMIWRMLSSPKKYCGKRIGPIKRSKKSST